MSVEHSATVELLRRLFDQGETPMQAVRYTSVPKLDRTTALVQLSSPLSAAYQAGAKVFSLWDHEPHGPFRVYVGGTRGFPRTTAGAATGPGVLFPPGAGAEPAGDPALTLAPRLDTPCWVRVGGVLDPTTPTADPEMLEDHAPFLGDADFRLLTIAVPMDPQAVVQEQDRVRRVLHGESERLETGWGELTRRRHAGRLEQLTRALAGGLWRVHLLCGAPTAEEAARVAALWATSSRPTGPAGHLLAPSSTPADLRTTLASSVSTDDPFALSSPFVAGSDALAAWCRPPVQEVPGVATRSTNPFDVAHPGYGEVDVGELLDVAYAPVGRLRIPLDSLARHTFVHGATGAGKSQATRHLLGELSRAGIPWVVLEPAKQEYAAGMQHRLGALGDQVADPALRQVHVIRPGDPEATPVALNPLEPDPRSSYQAHLDVLLDLMVAAFDADSPFPEVLAQGIDLAVRRSGWDPALTAPVQSLARHYRTGRPAYPGIPDLVRACHEVIDSKGYGREVAGNVHGFVDMRLGTLSTGTKRAAFSSGYPLSVDRVLRRNVVLELQDLGTDADRALYMGLFLSRLAQAARARHRSEPRPGEVRNVVVVEEAHRLLRHPDDLQGAAARAVESFTDLLAEVRSQGVALVVAEQIPRKIAPDVVKNTAVKWMGRTPAQDDRDLVGAAMGLTTTQSQQVVSLPPGVFAVHTDHDDSPLLVRFPHVPEPGGLAAADPAPLVEDLPPWTGRARSPGSARQRDMAWAAQVEANPRLVLLCELTVAAHLVHTPLPVVAADQRHQLLGGLRLPEGAVALDVAVGSLVRAAVGARRQVLGPYAPEDLCEVAAAAVRGRLDGDGPAVPDGRWCAAYEMWAWIKAQLQASDPTGPPHPQTATWQQWGADYVSGDTAGEQLARLEQALDRRADERATVLLGSARPGALERAVSSTGYSPERGLRVLLGWVEKRSLSDLRPLLTSVIEHARPPGGAP
ncbi:ATP-binding protein [uncultured Serinicoccus sp.]|uniref:ATP-binding protein n=1 Tax=uncultured Serinicoccus sp. TaxID=735514 RepID=UPI0026310EC0|nr:DUF87 domain-containing protein [uncultured Serinicoccus sp.]